MKPLFLAPLLFLLVETSFAREKMNYTISSDSQIQNVKGNFEANGNVVVKSINDKFEASSDKLTYDKESKSIKLFGNVFVKYLESEGLSIKSSTGDVLTIYTDTGLFEFDSSNDNRVKTKLKF